MHRCLDLIPDFGIQRLTWLKLLPKIGPDNHWLCLPVSLTVHAIRHLLCVRGWEVLLFPNSLLLIFGLFVNPTNGVVRHFVKECFVLPRCFPVFDPGRGHGLYCNGCEVVFLENPSFRVLALRFDCT